MTTDLLNQKIESLRNCLARIESKLPFTLETLESDYDLQDIIAINLERAVQVCVDIGARILAEEQGPSPTTMAETFQILLSQGTLSPEVAQNMKKAVGMRNMLVHEYSAVNWKIIHDVCHHHLTTFSNFVSEVCK